PGYEGIITIEHVLPQEPAEESEWCKNFTEDERNEWTNKIGNLILLSRRKNSRARNFDFKRKKEAYFFRDGVPPFRITQELEEYEEWSLSVLKSRQEKLVKEIIKIYFGT
ncbi:MAG: HNH endonuclease, partial [Actinobacteria bacterium]|nr:HNH endonuclease [Actinomycetota bacterium]